MKLMIEMPDKEAALQAACNAGLLGVHGTTSPEREDWIYEIVKAVIKSSVIEESIGTPREPDHQSYLRHPALQRHDTHRLHHQSREKRKR